MDLNTSVREMLNSAWGRAGNVPSFGSGAERRLGPGFRASRGNHRHWRVIGPLHRTPVGWSCSEMPYWIGVLLTTWGLLVRADPVAAADKVDVVHLRNNDRITCEIKKLEQSILTISTD